MKIAVGPGYEALTGAGSLFLGVDLERAGSMWICVNLEKEVCQYGDTLLLYRYKYPGKGPRGKDQARETLLRKCDGSCSLKQRC